MKLPCLEDARVSRGSATPSQYLEAEAAGGISTGTKTQLTSTPHSSQRQLLPFTTSYPTFLIVAIFYRFTIKTTN